jgi:acyl-coenzyme A thioesterase PaaI-like protein
MRESCTLISAYDVTATTPTNTGFEVSIDPYLCNVGGTLHGGAASTILDNLTGEVLHVMDRLWVREPGVDGDVLEARW